MKRIELKQRVLKIFKDMLTNKLPLRHYIGELYAIEIALWSGEGDDLPKDLYFVGLSIDGVDTNIITLNHLLGSASKWREVEKQIRYILENPNKLSVEYR